MDIGKLIYHDISKYTYLSIYIYHSKYVCDYHVPASKIELISPKAHHFPMEIAIKNCHWARRQRQRCMRQAVAEAAQRSQAAEATEGEAVEYDREYSIELTCNIYA